MPRTPLCVVVHFLGGHLPGTAVLQIRPLTLFGMICQLKDSVLYKTSEYQLTSSKHSNGSWIMQIRELCLQYRLPSPLSLLQSPLPKQRFKSLVKSLVLDYWEMKLRADAQPLDSLQYFNPKFMSLIRPHPIWTTCGSNPYEVNKAVIQARMLSGRYITDQLARHWTRNTAGTCQLEGCSPQAIGSLEHILLQCPALHSTRQKVVRHCLEVAENFTPVRDIVHTALGTDDYKHIMQFLLDPSCLPAVINLQQAYGTHLLHHLFKTTRNWCYSIHRRRMDLLGLFNFR